MIRAFPDLHPDELMYSGYARYARRVGYPNLKNIMGELFGSQQIIASVPFSSHLDYFMAHQPYPNRFTAESLIAEHTLLPFFTPFIPPERIQQLKVDMRGANGPSLFMRIGLMASVVPSPMYLRYCPDCAREDERRFGEKYWHRHHQIPGVSVCHVHEVWLENANVQIHDRKTRHKFIAAEEALQLVAASRPIDASLLCEILLFISNGAAWLLRQPDLSPGLEFLYKAYKQMLINRDLARYSGRIWMKELQEAFISYYADDILSYLHCNLDRRSPDNWLARLVRKPDGSQYPLQHLLLMRFLGCPIETLFSDLHTNSLPFGTGPWPCLNIASEHYRQHQVMQCEIMYSPYTGGRPLGIFLCDCGFVYSRIGPDRSPEDQSRIGKIRAFGLIWETKLQILWKDEAISLRGIACQLGVDPLTVKRHASRLGLPFPRFRGKISGLKENQQLRQHNLRMPEATALEEYRAEWLNLLQANPEIGIKKLRSKVPGVYTWLYRHDRAWLKEHAPVRARKNKPSNYRVNWLERDVQLAEETKVAALYLKNLPGRPTRITISAIGRRVGQTAILQQHLDKLPRTAEVLREHIESREAYAVRRVGWVVKDYQRRNIFPAKWQLIEDAGVTRLVKQPRIQEVINIAMQTLQRNIGS